MKKVMVVMLVLSLLALGCGDTKVIDGIKYDTYGLIDKEEKRNPDIEYKLITGNVVWGILLFETAIAPVYFFGFSLYEPVGKLDKNKPKGGI